MPSAVPAIVVPTNTFIPTSISTLSLESAYKSLSNLIEDESQCSLPCWLDITPGSVSFNKAKDIFSKYTGIARTDFSRKWINMLTLFPSRDAPISALSTTIYPYSNKEISHIIVNIRTVGNVSYTNQLYQDFWKRYFLPTIFKSYGSPEKIFLDTTRMAVDPTLQYPFVLWVVYPKHGFMLRYDGFNEKVGENLRICPLQSNITIKIWDIDIFNYEEFLRNESALAKPLSLGPQPLDAVTNLDIESFYKMFKDGGLSTCFDTREVLWTRN